MLPWRKNKISSLSSDDFPSSDTSRREALQAKRQAQWSAQQTKSKAREVNELARDVKIQGAENHFAELLKLSMVRK